MIKNIYTNRDDDKITFQEIEGNKVEVTGYNKSFIRLGEDINEFDKKTNPNRIKNLTFVDFPGGPFIFTGMDINDFLYNKDNNHRNLSKEFLNSNNRKIVTKIDLQEKKVILDYEEKLIKKESDSSKKNTSKKN